MTQFQKLRAAVDAEVAAEEREIEARNDRWVAIAVLGLAIREARLARGLSLRACAKAAKISAPFLSDIERGRRSMSDGTCEMLLGVLMTVRQL
jgi:hypothetical protein